MSCIFCYPTAADVVQRIGGVWARLDGHPVTHNHLLILPTRHVASVFDMNVREWDDLGVMLRLLELQLSAEDPTITGFNVGANCGESAGQTVMHAHVHLIPRRDGDTASPRGGVRGVIPEKMSY